MSALKSASWLFCLCCYLLALTEGTVGQEQGPGVRVVVDEGSDAVLPCLISTKEDITATTFDWKKDGQKEVFLYAAGIHYNNGRQGQDEQFKGRVSYFQDQLEYGNASIKIQNVKVTDSGNYSCIFPHLQPRRTFNIELVVGPAVKVVVKEEGDAVLPCLISTKENIIRGIFDWKKDGQKEVFLYDAGIHYNNGRQGQDEQFKGRVSHFQDQLMNGNASIKINNTKVTDSGIYSCDFPRLQPSQTLYIKLVVERLLKDRSGEISGASKPFITTILDATKDWSLLQCEVRGASPEPKVEWKDSAGNILPAEEPQVSESGGRYDVTIKTSVTKTGRYRCEVTQEEISHQTFTETVVFISEKLCEDQTTRVAVGWLGGFILGAVVFAAVLVGLKARKCITLSCNRAPEPTATSTDITNDNPLLPVGGTGDHRHQNS